MSRAVKDIRRGKPVKMATGGGLSMQIRKNGATPAGKPKSPGAPIAPKVKFRGKVGIRGG